MGGVRSTVAPNNRKMRMRPTLAVMAVFAVSIIWLVSAATASALSAPIHIANTGGEGVFIRPEPNTGRPAVGWMPEGASPDFHCFVWGQNLNGVPIWFNVAYNGVTGYYASYYDDSSYHSNKESLTAKYGVPLCGVGTALRALAWRVASWLHYATSLLFTGGHLLNY